MKIHLEHNEKYVKFKIIFHLFILLFAIGVTFSSIVEWNKLDRALLYLILGIIFIVESLLGLYINVRKLIVK